MAAALFALSTLPAEPSFGGAVWRLALLGVGVGAAFPAVTIGSMGSIRGQELGLGSGIVNMSRQVGFAIGIALFVAVFTGTIDNERSAGTRAHRRACPRRPSPAQAREIMREEARDAYGKAFLVGGFVVLLGIPFSLTMRRGPSDVHRGSEVAPRSRPPVDGRDAGDRRRIRLGGHLAVGVFMGYAARRTMDMAPCASTCAWSESSHDQRGRML